ncbi:hypothetical protein [Mycolicibacterium sarraceniae]|uniref:Uncharacterized protein n=1 Tax=Mycolicibacterium sarraceniae TaxID=1534348 RepID=A0A7I7SUF2_9MYCO|nr:hypothetical protein [Mycolicibacterium sarraceniae]BBY60323.1 hypothetical protein MSAR_34590 [Mycolicibacterium sarraceniae]
MPNGATNTWSKSNSPSLRQNQGVSGCNRNVRGDRAGCCFLCDVVHQELERAQRICEATGDAAHWVAAVTLNDALTDYYASDYRLYQAASEVGITDEQWHAIKHL